MKNEFSQGQQSAGSPSSGYQFPTEGKGDLKQSLRNAGEELKDKSKEAVTQFKEQGGRYFDKNKARTADCMGRFSETLRSTADRFEADKDPNIAYYTRLVAGKLNDAATYVRERDFSGLRKDTENLAREHPVLFFGGLFAVGLVAARFLKASGERLGDSFEEQVPEESSMMTGAIE